jgi:hypothetical protein
MTRTATGLGIAAALGFAVSLAAQTTTTPDQHTMRGDKGRDITVTGCLARGSDGTFVLDNAHMDDKTTTTTATGTTGTTAAEPSSRASTTTAGAAMKWTLEGGKDLERHIGHEIQVTGRSDWNEHSSASSSTSTSTATTTAMSDKAKLDVSSIKMIASSCK